MTHVGKILVLVIMAFSLVFLGTSTVVFVTSRNWKTATEQQKQEVAKVKKKFDEAQAVADAAKNELAAAQANAQAATKALENRIKTLED